MIIVKSALSILAVTSTATALSITPLRTTVSAGPSHASVTALHLEDPRANKQSDLDQILSKREEFKRQSMAESEPEQGPLVGSDIDKMSTDELKAYLFSDSDPDNIDFESLLAGEMPTWKTQRVSPKPTVSESKMSSSSDEDEEMFDFIDYEDGRSMDENSFHIPNRIGFTTVDWADEKKGFVNGKLKKADRKMGKYNKSDLKKVYNMLEKSGVTFIETSPTYGKANSLLSKINKSVELTQGPDVAATFPNPWKQAFRNRTRPKGGVNAVSKAAGDACRKLGVDTLSLFQVENPWYYIGGTKALARGMLETLQEGHAQNVGCVDMSITKLYKLQRLLAEDQESLATNQFEFSLTNRQNLDMIEACRKLGITPICRNVFDGGLATGKFTPTTPTGGSVSMGEGNAKGPYSLRKLEKLDALFQTMESVSQKVGERIKSDLMEIDKEVRPNVNTKITTSQIAINYVKYKGGVPLLSITNQRDARELIGCLGWDLTEDEVDELEKACKVCGL